MASVSPGRWAPGCSSTLQNFNFPHHFCSQAAYQIRQCDTVTPHNFGSIHVQFGGLLMWDQKLNLHISKVHKFVVNLTNRNRNGAKPLKRSTHSDNRSFKSTITTLKDTKTHHNTSQCKLGATSLSIQYPIQFLWSKLCPRHLSTRCVTIISFMQHYEGCMIFCRGGPKHASHPSFFVTGSQ